MTIVPPRFGVRAGCAIAVPGNALASRRLPQFRLADLMGLIGRLLELDPNEQEPARRKKGLLRRDE